MIMTTVEIKQKVLDEASILLPVPADRTVNCHLCQSSGQPFYRDIFWVCSQCKAIFRVTQYLPNPEAEKERYLKHHNDVSDPGYRSFVSPVTHAVLQDFTTESYGLDFGAGPGPVISRMLQEKGYPIEQYDPIFKNDTHLLSRKYDYIICCEVIEHFHNPRKEFALLYNLLKPGGKLYCMTHLYDQEIDFDKWYYKNDITHVFIYQRQTLEWIKEEFSFKCLTVSNRLVVFES